MEEKCTTLGLCIDSPTPAIQETLPSQAMKLMSGGSNARARVEQRRKEKKAETEPTFGEGLVCPVGRVDHGRWKTGPAHRPDQITSPQRCPSDTGSGWRRLFLTPAV